MTCAVPPELPQARVASATVAVELVAHRVLDVVVLMVILRGIERARHLDRGHDRFLERPRLLERRLGRLGGLSLRLVVIEDRGAVLVAGGAELAILYRGIAVH